MVMFFIHAYQLKVTLVYGICGGRICKNLRPHTHPCLCLCYLGCLAEFGSQPKFRRWEHVAFAFYVPHGVFNPPELQAHRHELQE